MTALCLLCGDSFEPREGGKPQRFCCPAHRRAFFKAAHAYVAWAVESGHLSRTEVRRLASRNAALPPDGQVGSEATQIGAAGQTRSQRENGSEQS